MSSHSYRSILSRRQMLQGFATVAAGSILSGCGATIFRSVTPSTSKLPPPTVPVSAVPSPVAPSPPPPSLPPPSQPPSPAAPTAAPQPLPIGAITAASLSVSANSEGAFGHGFVGLSYEKQTLHMPLFTGTNSDLIGLFNRLGDGVLRIGGTSVDETAWTPEGKGQTAGQIAPADVDSLASFLRATGWTCIYGVNLGGSATGATTPALAAAEVSYVAKQLGSSLVGIELGNECENYGDPGSYYAYNWTVEMFESLWMQYRTAIVAVTPRAPISGPAAAANVYGWTIPFGEYVTRSSINLLTQHYNRGPGIASNATIDNLLSPDTALANLLQELTYGAQSIDVPFRIAECNSYSGGGIAGVSNAYASSLWAIDMIFNTALGGAAGVNFHGGNNATYTPIADSLGSVVGPQPIFYGLLLATMAGQGTLLSTDLSAGSLNVTSYAVKNPDGGLSLVLVNKDATQSLDLSIALPTSMTSATLLSMTQLSAGTIAPSLTALSGVTIQGATVATDGAFNPGTAYTLTLSGEQLSCYVPALSAVLIQIA
jgi:hypothetical protein